MRCHKVLISKARFLIHT